MNQDHSSGRFRWALPTVGDLIIYVILVALTIIFSNIRPLERFLGVSLNLASFKQSSLGWLQHLLNGLLGEQLTTWVANSIFWMLIGSVAYGLVWLLAYFSEGFRNGLRFRRYVRPPGVDRDQQMRAFLVHSAFQVVIFVIFIMYINVIFDKILPLCSSAFSQLVAHWPERDVLINGGLTIVFEIVAIHGVVVLMRLLLLRQRVYDS